MLLYIQKIQNISLPSVAKVSIIITATKTTVAARNMFVLQTIFDVINKNMTVRKRQTFFSLYGCLRKC